MNFYLWEYSQEDNEPAIYGGWKDIGISFYTGDMIKNTVMPPLPLEIMLNNDFDGNLTDALCVVGGPPVFSKRLISLLTKIGVDNLQVFPCTIVDQNKRVVSADYSIVNIIGKVACIDFDKSDVECLTTDDSQILGYTYLTLDEKRIGNFQFFVLAEMPVQIVIHKEIASKMQDHEITGVDFVAQGNPLDLLNKY